MSSVGEKAEAVVKSFALGTSLRKKKEDDLVALGEISSKK